jgi:hypothetical protein
MITEDTKETIRLYVEEGYSSGGFMTAVLCNDLMDALSTADLENRANIFDIVQYIYNNIPFGVWGSREIVTEHFQSFKNKKVEDSSDIL